LCLDYSPVVLVKGELAEVQQARRDAQRVGHLKWVEPEHSHGVANGHEVLGVVHIAQLEDPALVRVPKRMRMKASHTENRFGI